MKVSTQLRRAIRKSGLSRYRIAVESGIDQAALSRLMSGGDVTTRTLDALAKVLRFRLECDGPRPGLLNRHGR